jgi:hypothetical protein
MAGVGHRLDGWANSDLDVGRSCLSLPLPFWMTPRGQSSWTVGSGKYDPRHHYFDGTNIVPFP